MFEALRPRAHACARVRCARAIPVQHAPGRELKLRVRWQLPFPGHASGFRFSGEGIGFSLVGGCCARTFIAKLRRVCMELVLWLLWSLHPSYVNVSTAI